MGDSPNSPRPRPRFYIGVTLSLLLIAGLPFFTAALAYGRVNLPIEWDLAFAASALSFGLGVLALAGFGVTALISFLKRRDLASPFAAPNSIDDPEVIRNLLATHDLPCPRCRYNLRGLPPGNCPECQEPIRLFVVGHRTLRPIIWVTRLVLTACTLKALTAALQVFWLVSVMNTGVLGGMSFALVYYVVSPAATLLGFLWLIITTIRWIRCRDSERREALHWRTVWTAVSLLTLFLLIDLVWGVIQMYLW